MLYVARELVRVGHIVVYLDWEMGEADLYERLSDMGAGLQTDLSRLVYINHVELPPLDTPDGGRELGIWLDEIGAEFLERHIVVIDTIGRAVSGEENSSDTVQAFSRYAGQELRRRGVTRVRLDHAGHEGEHARGASGKGDDVDIVWRLASTDDGLTPKVNRRRISWVSEQVVFRRIDDGPLRYESATALWPDGTKELARILDALGVPIDVATRTIQQRLKQSGAGRRRRMLRDRVAAARSSGLLPAHPQSYSVYSLHSLGSGGDVAVACAWRMRQPCMKSARAEGGSNSRVRRSGERACAAQLPMTSLSSSCSRTMVRLRSVSSSVRSRRPARLS